MKTLAAFFLVLPVALQANGTLTSDIRISSEVLGYDLQYRVYVPEKTGDRETVSVLYVTDGPGYISEGRMPRVLDEMIGDASIEPLVVVFVDARDPDNLSTNRRNSQFLCNQEFLSFFERELIPQIEQDYPVGRSRDHRGILGVSFGGTNAACFGLMGYETFSKIGMHSPANHPIKGLLPAYEEMPLLPLRMFLSTGKPDDNTRANRKFRGVLQRKGYDLKYIERTAGHDWDNWRPLVDDVLQFFYAPVSDSASNM